MALKDPSYTGMDQATTNALRGWLPQLKAHLTALGSTYVSHSLAAAAKDFLVASAAGTFVKKTLAETQTILGLGSAAYTASTDYAVAAKGVTNGDSHDHAGGDGAQINHTGLSNIGTNAHSAIDTFIASKAAASGLASLNASTKVVEDPANATATPTASKIPIADAGGKLDGWITPTSVLSNVIFCWNGADAGTDNSFSLVTNVGTLLQDMNSYTATYQYFGTHNVNYRTILTSKFTKIAGISTITINARLWATTNEAAKEAILFVDIGGQSNTVKSVTSTTPTWVTSADIDVSGLTNGTTYDITIRLKNEGASSAYCSGVILIAS